MNIKERIHHNQMLERLLKGRPLCSLGRNKKFPLSLSQGGTTDGCRGVTENLRFISGIYSLTHDVSILGTGVTTNLLGTIKLLGTAQNQGRYNLAQKIFF